MISSAIFSLSLWSLTLAVVPGAQTAAPETAAPETAAPETAAPETAAPETTAPETTAPETTAPETTAPGTTAPKMDGSEPPNPGAPPSEGVYAVGSSAVAPLPPASPPVPPSAIPRGSWRGVGWISLRLLGAGPIAGQAPARATVIGLGGGAEWGWRARQWIGIGGGFTRVPQETFQQELSGSGTVVNLRGYMTTWDLAFARLYAPVRGRVDPFIDIGGGLSFYDPARERPTLLGATVRGSAGIEAWVSKQITIGISGMYRANFVDGTIGHSWQAAIDVGIHW